jgi:hypothetical protein
MRPWFLNRISFSNRTYRRTFEFANSDRYDCARQQKRFLGMKKYICLIVGLGLLAGCEKKETNVTNPPEKKESSSTTIVNPSPAKSP